MDDSDSRIRWLCRRGMKELDVLLERYLAGPWRQADTEERTVFRGLLDLEDPDLYALCMGKLTPLPAHAALIEKLRKKA